MLQPPPHAHSLAAATLAQPSTQHDVLQIMQFCENLKTLTQDMSFGMSLAGGALISAKNDLSAAANLCTELS